MDGKTIEKHIFSFIKRLGGHSLTLGDLRIFITLFEIGHPDFQPPSYDR